jgi:hypothetical protein
MTAFIAVAVVVALLCYVWPQPPEDGTGPGEDAP